MLQTKNQLVAAALLGSETEADIIARLQAALMGQLDQQQSSATAVSADAAAKTKPKELPAHADETPPPAAKDETPPPAKEEKPANGE
jgi:hypothetical protein